MRRAGLLLHPSSLPGPYGIGCIGPGARALMAWMESAGLSIWQFLPLNPVDGLGCPYASPSAFAAEPLLISIDDLVRDGWLMRTERPLYAGGIDQVDWSAMRRLKEPMLRRAARRVARTVDLTEWASERSWVQPWAEYAARARRDGSDWPSWSSNAPDVSPDAIAEEVGLQWLFDHQWAELRQTAGEHGVSLWGDLPMFVGAQSADTWSHPELFQLGSDHRPRVVTGAPPDDFTPDGQKWGHAHFDVQAHRQTEHAWWLARVHRLLEHVDAVRLDHFRGLSAVWEIPAHDPDARGGQWVSGLGAPLLSAIQDTFGHVPIVAEDLGVITPDVASLRDSFDLPGMAILQFGFSTDADNSQPYLPHNHRRNLVVYPGTHDNNTVRGWYDAADHGTRDHARRYLSVSGDDIAGDLTRAAYRSVADTCIVALQDILALDARSRMNTPGTAHGNWSWRVRAQALNVQVAARLHAEATLTGRV